MNLAKWLISAFHNIRVAGHTSTRRPYTGDELRAIRKRNGVGRPPATWANRSVGRSLQAWQANRMAAKLPPMISMCDRDLVAHYWRQPLPGTNYAEWQRKPRPTPRGVTVNA